MFHFEGYIMADSSSQSNHVMEVEYTWTIPVSSDIGPDNNCMDSKFTRQVQEHYALKQAINIFPRPHHPAYNTLITRTRSFEHADWSETNPSRVSMAEAGFF
jgi:hypothetical protein